MGPEVALSTGGLIVGAVLGAGISSVTARRLDTAARRREARQETARVRAAAAFIRADLDVCRRRLREAQDDGEWLVFYRLPTAAWHEHGPVIAVHLRPDDVARVAHSFARIEDFENAMGSLPVRRFGLVTEGAPKPIPFDDGMREKVKEIAQLTARALYVLEGLAPHSKHPRPLAGQSELRPAQDDANSAS